MLTGLCTPIVDSAARYDRHIGILSNVKIIIYSFGKSRLAYDDRYMYAFTPDFRLYYDINTRIPGNLKRDLMQKEYCVSDLAQKMEITESAISHQLRALRIARLAQSHKAGKNVIYSLQDEHIRWILEKTYDHISER